MAKKSKIVECKILKFEPNPQGGQNVFIECSIGKRVWYIERWLNYNRPISMEEFIEELKKTKIIPDEPEDFLAYVKQEADQPFKVVVDGS